jgi:hypothetical protein
MVESTLNPIHRSVNGWQVELGVNTSPANQYNWPIP